MKSGYRSILLLLIALIIAGGALLFILRDQLLDVLRSQTGVNQLTLPTAVSSSAAKDVLDLEVLKSPTFISLKDNVVKFDFDNICQQSSSVKAPVSVIVGEENTTPESSQCVLGNNVPFFIKNN